MGKLNYNEKDGIFSLILDIHELTEEKIISAGLKLVDKCEGHFLVEYKDQVYDINTSNSTILHHRSNDGCCGRLYYGFSYLHEIKKLLQ